MRDKLERVETASELWAVFAHDTWVVVPIASIMWADKEAARQQHTIDN